MNKQEYDRGKTNAQILEKALNMALANGWKPFKRGISTIVTQWQSGESIELAVVFDDNNREVQWVRELEGIIYNHDFAKALWGEGLALSKSWVTENKPSGVKLWQWRLAQMVVAEDAIAYLGEHI